MTNDEILLIQRQALNELSLNPNSVHATDKLRLINEIRKLNIMLDITNQLVMILANSIDTFTGEGE